MTDEYRPSIAGALKGMFSFFTMIPINIEKKHMDDMNRCFWLVPIVGLFYGIIAVTVFGLVYKFISFWMAAAVTIFVIGFMNRFLHLDGTIDVGDGLTVAGTREDHVRALKDTLIGAGGMVTGVLVILLTFSEYMSITIVPFLMIGFAAEVLARNAQVAAAAFGTPGNGMAGDSVRYTNKMSLLKSSILTTVILGGGFNLMAWIGKELLGGTIYYAYHIGYVVAFFVSILWGFLMAKVAEKNFGMVNGDVLGATNETSRVVVLFVMIAILTIMTGM